MTWLPVVVNVVVFAVVFLALWVALCIVAVLLFGRWTS